jgi:carbon storage regulator CsrA
MLVLSRKVGEQIVIDGDIVLTVVEVSGNRIRLGITAPRDKAVVRGELVGFGHDLEACIPTTITPTPTISTSCDVGFSLV